MKRVIHIIGNGDHSFLYQDAPRRGLKLACNQIAFQVPEKYATCIVDYKFMNALAKQQVELDGEWVLGFRPKHWMEMNPNHFVKVAHQVKEFYTVLPDYVANYTDLNCGHMATHYACNKLKADEVHMYGFDSIFDFNVKSVSDFNGALQSDRGNTNNNRLTNNWRPVWQSMFREFKDVQFVLHHSHDKYKINVDNNVTTEIYSKRSEVKKNKDGSVSFANLSEA